MGLPDLPATPDWAVPRVQLVRALVPPVPQVRAVRREGRRDRLALPDLAERLAVPPVPRDLQERPVLADLRGQPAPQDLQAAEGLAARRDLRGMVLPGQPARQGQYLPVSVTISVHSIQGCPATRN